MLLRTEGQLTTASSPAAVSRQQLRPYQRLGQKGELPFPVPLGFNCSKRLSRTAVRLLLLAEYDDAEEEDPEKGRIKK